MAKVIQNTVIQANNFDCDNWISSVNLKPLLFINFHSSGLTKLIQVASFVLLLLVLTIPKRGIESALKIWPLLKLLAKIKSARLHLVAKSLQLLEAFNFFSQCVQNVKLERLGSPWASTHSTDSREAT